MDIIGFLQADYGIDPIDTGHGIVAMLRTDIAPSGYEVAISAPLNKEQIDDIVRFGQGASEMLIRELYGSCTGIKIGATKFCIYGMTFDPAEGSGPYARYNIPFDLNTPNLWERIKGLEETSLIIARSNQYHAEGYTSYIHTIDADDKISTRLKDDAAKVLTSYDSLEVWLKTELHAALSQKDKW
jgi:hypothetical protein